MDPCFFLIAARYAGLYILTCDNCTCLLWLCHKLKTSLVYTLIEEEDLVYEGAGVKVQSPGVCRIMLEKNRVLCFQCHL